MGTTNNPTAKVLFRIVQKDGSVDIETLWAYDLGEDRYMLDNSPFYAYGISWHDVVHAPYDPDESFAAYKQIISKSGNRTLRIVFDTALVDGNATHAVLQDLIGFGCSYVGANNIYFSVNIPSEIKFETITKYLTEKNINWEYADPTYEQMYPDEDLA